jgi:putative membrane protein insertion efficiency factor
MHPVGSLEHLVVRPKINYAAAAISASVWMTAGVSIGVFVSSGIERMTSSTGADHPGFGSQLLAGSLGVLTIFLLRLSPVMIFCLRLYQRYADAEVRLRCRQTPTCSNYAVMAISKYGALKGAWKAVGRLRRCRPPGSVDFP